MQIPPLPSRKFSGNMSAQVIWGTKELIDKVVAKVSRIHPSTLAES